MLIYRRPHATLARGEDSRPLGDRPDRHGAAFGIDVVLTLRLWVRWRLLVARERRNG